MAIARKPTLLHRVEYAGLIGLRALFRLLPVDRASALMGWLWRVIAPRLHRHPRALAHLARAYPDKSPQELDRIARAMWENLGRVTAEGLLIDRLAAEPERIVNAMRADAVAAFEQSRSTGAVVVSLHAGNWEIVVLPARALGCDAAGVYQTISNPLVEAKLLAIRQPYYPGGLYPKGPSTVRAVLSHVRRGGSIALLADHRDTRGMVIDFLGAPAWATRAPAFFARSFGVPLIVGRIVRTGPGARFRLEAEVVAMPQTPDREADIDAATRTINRRFEDWINEAPEQWMWIHQRWLKPGDPQAGAGT